MQRFGYLQRHITVAGLMNKSDHDLFCKLCAPPHALNHLLPPTRNRASLRTRGHSYQLPEYSTDLHEKSYLIRSLYSFVKWNSFYSFFGFAALYCTSFWLWFLCLLFDVRLSHILTPRGRQKEPGARFTKYLTTVLRLSYDNAKVTGRLTTDV